MVLRLSSTCSPKMALIDSNCRLLPLTVARTNSPSDPDHTSPIVKSSQPGESGPEVELVRATVKGNKRQLESIKAIFGEQVEESRKTMSLERWEIAPTVYRFTLGEPL